MKNDQALQIKKLKQEKEILFATKESYYQETARLQGQLEKLTSDYDVLFAKCDTLNNKLRLANERIGYMSIKMNFPDVSVN